MRPDFMLQGSTTASLQSAPCSSKAAKLFCKKPSKDCSNICRCSSTVLKGGSRRHHGALVASAVPDTKKASSGGGSNGTKMGARERRLVKVKEERRRRESEYPEWAKVLEEAAKDDAELREVLGDSIGNPEEMRERVEARAKRKGEGGLLQNKTGSAIPMEVHFRSYDPFDLFIWLELYGKPTQKQVDIIGGVFRAWFLLGRLGSFNSMNIQLTEQPVGEAPRYNEAHGQAALQAYFHNIGDVEFQDNWCRVWVDMGTSDPLALDVLINGLLTISSENVGLKHLVIGGKKLGDWEEGMTNPEDGYQIYKI